MNILETIIIGCFLYFVPTDQHAEANSQQTSTEQAVNNITQIVKREPAPPQQQPQQLPPWSQLHQQQGNQQNVASSSVQGNVNPRHTEYQTPQCSA